MTTYSTLDYLPDLTPSEIASAQSINFLPYTPSSTGWDSRAMYSTSEDNAILHDKFVFEGKAGATYDIYSFSYLDPFLLELFDSKGNVIATDDNSGDSGSDHIKYVAPYTGEYYINASWHQDTADANKFVSIASYEDIDTASSVGGSLESRADQIFDWAEDNYPILFPNHPESHEVFGYHARLYSNGEALGEKDGSIYLYDGGVGGTDTIILVGAVNDFI